MNVLLSYWSLRLLRAELVSDSSDFRKYLLNDWNQYKFKYSMKLETHAQKITWIHTWALLAGWLVSIYRLNWLRSIYNTNNKNVFPKNSWHLARNVRICGCPLIAYLCADQNVCLISSHRSLNTLTLAPFLHLAGEHQLKVFTQLCHDCHMFDCNWEEPLILRCIPISEKKNCGQNEFLRISGIRNGNYNNFVNSSTVLTAFNLRWLWISYLIFL